MLIGIIVMMLLIIFTKMHAFPSLIISAVLIAVLAMPFGDVTTLSQCISTVTAGFGSTMTSIGIVMASAASWVFSWKRAAPPSAWR